MIHASSAITVHAVPLQAWSGPEGSRKLRLINVHAVPVIPPVDFWVLFWKVSEIIHI